jgi:hypothetical protein
MGEMWMQSYPSTLALRTSKALSSRGEAQDVAKRLFVNDC